MKRTSLVVLIAIVVGMGLRVAAGGTRLLWNDEAETTINSLQVLDHGYPSSTFKGKPLYENAVFMPSADPRYAYESTNYYNTTFERNKGWLTYYYQAVFLKIFGFSTFVARLPFILLSGLTILLLFLLGRRMFNPWVGAAASCLYAVNYFSIWFDMQARYYALVATLSTLLLYAVYRSLTEGDKRSYMLSCIALILLFYTHIVAFVAAMLFFVLAHIYRDRGFRAALRPNIIVTLAIVALTAIPWVVLVRLWELTSVFSDRSLVTYWALIVIMVGLGTVAVVRFGQLYLGFEPKRFSATNLLLLFIATVFVVKPFLTPAESFNARTFIELTPVFCILGASLIVQFRTRQRIGNLALLFRCVVLVCAFAFFNVATGRVGWVSLDTQWVSSALSRLKEQHIDQTTPIFVSFQQFSFMLYSDYNIDLVWPIRKSYIDEYPGRLLFILNYRMLWPDNFYRKALLPMREYNFANRLRHCSAQQIEPEIVLYDCPPPT